jgi:hypothetical protein
VIPVGSPHDLQELERWTRIRTGSDRASFHRETLIPVRFVSFIGKAALIDDAFGVRRKGVKLVF